MAPKDLYERLGVKRDASQADIKAAYRSKAKTTHPDKNGGTNAAFNEIAEAYFVLENPHARALYDATGQTEQEGPGGNNLDTAALNLLNGFLDAIAEQGEPHPGVDPFRDIREEIDNRMVKAGEHIKQIEAKISRIESLAKRIHKKTGSNQLRRMQEHNIARMKVALNGPRQHVELFKLAKEILAEYEFEVEKPTSRRFVTLGGSASGTTTAASSFHEWHSRG